jgi:hypothetical protein
MLSAVAGSPNRDAVGPRGNYRYLQLPMLMPRPYCWLLAVEVDVTARRGNYRPTVLAGAGRQHETVWRWGEIIRFHHWANLRLTCIKGVPA